LISFTLYVAGVEAGNRELQLLELPSGQALEIMSFPGSGKSRVLWLPSERGFQEAQQEHASRLSDLGHTVWLADLHEAYFVERNRHSITQFPLEDTIALIEAATRGPGASLVLLSSSRGAQLALIAAREWQLRNPGKSQVKGLILLHAHLYESRPEIGSEASYLPVSMATNLPVYLLDAQYSTKSAHINKLAETLASGGSQVFSHVLPGVRGGFFARADDDSSPADRSAKRNFANTLDLAIKALNRVATPTGAAASAVETRRFARAAAQKTALTPLDNKMPAPALRLRDITGQPFALDQRAGKTVLVNFWASWCSPCVEEIPSLHRLRSKIDNPDFEIITVNVREERERIDDFRARVPIELPLLLDDQGIVSSAWKVYVYPSSYLVDHQGNIRYAYLGALEWDSPEIIAIIQNLLNQR
jgi:thiol-disulfide isomerase/thioredoxin